MTFELSAQQAAARDAAAVFARERLAAVAATIDQSANIPSDLLRDLAAMTGRASDDAVALVSVVEQLATESAAAAAASALGSAIGAAAGTGLRGFTPQSEGDTRGRLVIAAVALGIGRAAIDAALRTLRESARQSQDQEKPHWAVADAATEVMAARALTQSAAQETGNETQAAGIVAMAKLAASRAAQQAVDVAFRVLGPEALACGSLLERLSRDARAVSLIFGTEEDLRATAAAAMLPG
jgi:hypothetical protein